MSDASEIKEAAHDLRNNMHAFEMALVVMEQSDSMETRNEMIKMLRNEITDTKKNIERFIGLVESDAGHGGRIDLPHPNPASNADRPQF